MNRKLLNILNSIGIYTKVQLEECEKEKKEIRNYLELLKNSSNGLRDQLRKVNKTITSIPYEFDDLVNIWTPNQTNALVYKIINKTRNSPELRSWLDVWTNRINDAKTSLDKELNLEEIDGNK